MIRIRGWDSLYEPPRRDLGRDGDGPLRYVKCRVYGHKISSGMLDLADAVPDGHLEAFGLFLKLLEFAGSQPRATRDGAARDNHGQPATITWIARRVMAPEARVAKLLAGLALARWIEVDEDDARLIEDLAELPSGKVARSQPPSVSEVTAEPVAANDGVDDTPTPCRQHADDTPTARRQPVVGNVTETETETKTETENRNTGIPKPKTSPAPPSAREIGHPRDGPSDSASVFARSGLSASDFGAKAVILGQLKLGEIERFRRVLSDTSRQGDSDRTSRDAMLRALGRGCSSEGEMIERLDGLLSKARQIGRSRTARSVMAELTAWFKRTHGGWR